jgi:hypothetical protein
MEKKEQRERSSQENQEREAAMKSAVHLRFAKWTAEKLKLRKAKQLTFT